MLLALFLIASSSQPTTCNIDNDCAGGSVCAADNTCVVAPHRVRVEDHYARPPIFHDGQWHEDEPIPDGAHVEVRTRFALVVTGASVLAAAWVGDWGETLSGCTRCGAQIPLSFIPLAGPFAQAALFRYPSGLLSGLYELERIALVFDGLAQLAGAGLVIGGLLHPRRVLVFDGPGSMRVTLVPTGAGVAALGTF